MILPEPARSLWRRVAAPLRAEMNTLDRFEPWKIGGGTTLAARWNHRKSTDIDLKVAPNAGLILLRSKYGGTLEKTMEQLGATRIRHQDRQISIHFDEGKIDIAQGRCVPATGHTVESMDGHAEIVLSTPQILHGKLHGRSLRSPVRDLYDFAVTNELEPEALEIAVNTLHDGQFTETMHNWLAERLNYQEDARSEITAADDRWSPIMADPAAEAVRAIGDRRYKTVTLEIDGRELHAACVCMDGTERHRTHSMTSSVELNDWLDGTGLAEYGDVAPDRDSRRIIWKARAMAARIEAPERGGKR